MKKNILLAIGACVISFATVSVFATDGEGSPKTSVSTTYIGQNCSTGNGPSGAQCTAYDTTTIWCKGTSLSDCTGSTVQGLNYSCVCTKQITSAFKCIAK